jgi:protein-histidine pros-kinase
MADAAFKTLVVYLAAVFLASLIALDLVVVFTIARPVARLSAMADKISMGEMDIPELPVRGGDEISVLAGSFNRMRRSLMKAMKMLEDQ